MRRGLFLLLLVSLLSPLAAQRINSKPISEKFDYDAYYNWGILWIRAGDITFSDTPSKEYPNARHLFLDGRTTSSWDNIFYIRDTIISVHDADSFKPYHFKRIAHEGNYNKIFDHLFDWEAGEIRSHIHSIGKYERDDTLALKPNTLDFVSAAWSMRHADFEAMTVGDSIPARLFVDDTIHDLYMRYLGREDVKIKGGGSNNKRDCFVFAPLLVGGKIFKGGEDMKIWISADEQRIPVMLEAKIVVGSVKMILNQSEVSY